VMRSLLLLRRWGRCCCWGDEVITYAWIVY
jgi:hypothetical protein